MKRILIPVLAGGLFAFLHAAAFPPLGVPEAAYLFAVPMVLWALARPDWRTFGQTALLASLVSWMSILVWLLETSAYATGVQSFFVGMGWTVLSLALAMFLFAWLLLVRGAVGTVLRGGFTVRVMAWLGLSGIWVAMEWVRTWLFTGFPWLPLAASQVERSALLQLASVTGGWGISFLLVFFNLALAWAARGLRDRSGKPLRFGFVLRAPEFLLAMAVVLAVAVWPLTWGKQERNWQPLGEVAIVQPAISLSLVWNRAESLAVLTTLDRITRNTLGIGEPTLEPGESYALGPPGEVDLILWPESATPFPLFGNPDMKEWAETRVQLYGAPLLLGNLAYERESDRWANVFAAVDPEGGRRDDYYRKRQLVPFGEYLPFESVIGFARGLLPFEDSFVQGKTPGLLSVALQGQTFAVGPLICYESIFPGLARETVAGGADFLVVVTNNAWFGRSAMSAQHRAHAVLRAVETRRPLLQSGNTGWSGWIDEYGSLRGEVADAEGDFRIAGGAVMSVSYDANRQGETTLYVRWGDWFVWLSMGLGVALVGLLLATRRSEKP